ncbi:MAG: hypothetical protein H2184_15640 [Candidatus Galacturonibacter soehngenii]|nr:hypothetical protein [Candidatus Galacturonibacter soehngenii]
MRDMEDWVFGTDLFQDTDNFCPYTGEYCEGLEFSNCVCISCDIGLAHMDEQDIGG